MPADHYCVLADVNALGVQVPFTASSKPSDTTVNALIESVAQRIDATIGNVGYVVPVVSGAKALGLLREACAWGALGLAQQMRNTGVGTAVSASGHEMKNIWLQMFEDWLKRLCSSQDPFELPDAPRTNQQLEKQGDAILRSFVQSIPGDDLDYDPDHPAVSRYQTL